MRSRTVILGSLVVMLGLTLTSLPAFACSPGTDCDVAGVGSFGGFVATQSNLGVASLPGGRYTVDFIATVYENETTEVYTYVYSFHLADDIKNGTAISHISTASDFGSGMNFSSSLNWGMVFGTGCNGVIGACTSSGVDDCKDIGVSCNGGVGFNFGSSSFETNPHHLTKKGQTYTFYVQSLQAPGTGTWGSQDHGNNAFGTALNPLAPVPEPASLGLLGTGLLAIGFWRRRLFGHRAS